MFWLQCCRSTDVFIIQLFLELCHCLHHCVIMLKWMCLTSDSWSQSSCVSSLLLHQVAVQAQCWCLMSVISTWSELDLIRLLLSADWMFRPSGVRVTHLSVAVLIAAAGVFHVSLRSFQQLQERNCCFYFISSLLKPPSAINKIFCSSNLLKLADALLLCLVCAHYSCRQRW